MKMNDGTFNPFERNPFTANAKTPMEEIKMNNSYTLDECVDLEISYAPEILREDAEYIALKREEIEKDIESLQKNYPYKTKGEILAMKYYNIKTCHEAKK